METEARARIESGNGSDYGLLGFAGNISDRVCRLCERFQERTACCCSVTSASDRVYFVDSPKF
jgi:hypothetical protein